MKVHDFLPLFMLHFDLQLKLQLKPCEPCSGSCRCKGLTMKEKKTLSDAYNVVEQ